MARRQPAQGGDVSASHTHTQHSTALESQRVCAQMDETEKIRRHQSGEGQTAWNWSQALEQYNSGNLVGKESAESVSVNLYRSCAEGTMHALYTLSAKGRSSVRYNRLWPIFTAAQGQGFSCVPRRAYGWAYLLLKLELCVSEPPLPPRLVRWIINLTRCATTVETLQTLLTTQALELLSVQDGIIINQIHIHTHTHTPVHFSLRLPFTHKSDLHSYFDVPVWSPVLSPSPLGQTQRRRRQAIQGRDTERCPAISNYINKYQKCNKACSELAVRQGISQILTNPAIQAVTGTDWLTGNAASSNLFFFHFPLMLCQFYSGPFRGTIRFSNYIRLQLRCQ